MVAVLDFGIVIDIIIITITTFLWFVVFGLLCHHTASNLITAGTHTSGAQCEGSLQNPDRIERHSRNGTWTRRTRIHILANNRAMVHNTHP